MAKVCNSCGAPVKDGARFCPACGAAQESSKAVAEAQELAPPQPQERAQIVSDERSQWVSFARSVYEDINTKGSFTGQQIPAPFAKQFDLSEKRIAAAPWQLYQFTGIGNGPAQLDQTAAAVSTAVNPYVGVGYLVGYGIARSKAKQDAIPRWVLEDEGVITITEYGFYFADTDNGGVIKPWGYTNFSSAQMTDWNTLEADFMSDTHSGKAMIVSPAATLLFALWCLACYPDHPQLAGVLNA